MKKFVAFAVAFALLTVSAFAGVTTMTKEASEADYPGVLVPGSLTGLDTFITDLDVIGNAAIFEYFKANPYGQVVLKNNMGALGVSFMPSNGMTLTGITLNMPSDLLTLRYLTDIGGMNAGAAVIYGSDISGMENKEVNSVPMAPDKTSNLKQHIGVDLGIALKGGIDIGLGLGIENDGGEAIDYDDAVTTSKQADWQQNTDNSKLVASIAGRLNLDKDTRAVVAVDIVTGKDKTITKVDNNNNGSFTDAGDINTESTTSNTELGVSAMLGKDIKASESITLKTACGLGFNTGSSPMTETKLVNANTKSYSAAGYGIVTFTATANFAIEGKLNDTWMVNAGVGTDILMIHMAGDKTNPDTTNSKLNDVLTAGGFSIDPALSAAIGVTGKIGDLMIDFQFEPSIFMAGPYFLTGQPSGDLNLNAAVTYSWK